MAHAELSPSSASRWMACPGSVALCRGLTDDSSDYADEGTDAHELAAFCLESGLDASGQVGRTMEKGNVVDAEMALAVQDYVSYVRDVVSATNGTLMVEQKLSISSITGEADAHGTSDVVILAGDELIVCDLKFGRGVPVDAIENPQLQIYALAAYEEFSLAYDFKQVRMVIHQPRLGVVSEWTQSVDDLLAFGKEVAMAAATTRLVDAPLHPTSKGCKWCRAKATCPALAQEALNDFAVVAPVDASASHLAQVMAKADMFEAWIKAIRAETEKRLLEGHEVPGFKLVQGRRGARAWADDAVAEAWLKPRLKLDELYDFKLASPTTISKRLVPWVDATGATREPVLGPRQQKQLLELITQAEGKPSVAAADDKRPALVVAANLDDFVDLS